MIHTRNMIAESLDAIDGNLQPNAHKRYSDIASINISLNEDGSFTISTNFVKGFGRSKIYAPSTPSHEEKQ